ncbi:hypothetical protein J6590_052934 [Homalodisca vitripennis]|nr:hypothetical protein J6590_052934 [Homalodisca vitripennis]
MRGVAYCGVCYLQAVRQKCQSPPGYRKFGSSPVRLINCVTRDAVSDDRRADSADLKRHSWPSFTPVEHFAPKRSYLEICYWKPATLKLRLQFQASGPQGRAMLADKVPSSSVTMSNRTIKIALAASQSSAAAALLEPSLTMFHDESITSTLATQRRARVQIYFPVRV